MMNENRPKTGMKPEFFPWFRLRKLISLMFHICYSADIDSPHKDADLTGKFFEGTIDEFCLQGFRCVRKSWPATGR